MKFIAYTHYSPLIHGSGGERYLQNLLESLSFKHNKCICWCREDSNKTRIENNVQYLHEVNTDSSFEEFVRKEKPDFIITHFHSSTYAIQLAHSLKIKVIYITHNDMAMTTQKEIALLKEDDICVFNTFWIFNKLAKLTKARTCVVHPVIQLPRKLKLEQRKFITFVNPTKAKGSDIFYRTALMLRDKQFLVVKGGYGNQDIRKVKNVKIIENTQDIFNDVYSKTRLLVAPSLYETYGMVAAEAASLGIPCIVSKTAGFHECLGEAGILVNSVKAADWVVAIRKFDDENYYKKYSLLCRERMQQEREKSYFEDFYKIVEFLHNKHF